MEQLNAVNIKLADKSSVNVKVGDKLELVCDEVAVVTRLNAPTHDIWVLEAEVNDSLHWWNAEGVCIDYANYRIMYIKSVIPAEEKLTPFTSKLSQTIDIKTPYTSHLRIVKRQDDIESYVDLMVGRVVMLANGHYTVIKATSYHNEKTIYGYSPNTHIQPTWDYELNYTTGETDYNITSVVEDAYFIFSNNIGLITNGSVVKLLDGQEAIITEIAQSFPRGVIIYGKTIKGNYSLKWDNDGKNKSFITPNADIVSVTSCNFRNGYPTFENFQSTSANQNDKESTMSETKETTELKAIPTPELDLQVGSQVRLTNGKVAFVGRIPHELKNPYHYYFVELPSGRERIVDVRPEHQADNEIGVVEVLCGPERLTEYYFDFRNIKQGDTYNYIVNGGVTTKVYSGDAIDVLNSTNPLVFDTRFLATWHLMQFRRVLGEVPHEEQVDSPKYEILPEEVSGPDGGSYCQIRALRDIPEIDVNKGDLGGFVASQISLSHSGNSWVFEGGYIGANAIVEDDAIVGDGATVTGTAHVKDNAVICHGVVVDGDAVVGGDVVVRAGNIGKGAVVTKQNHYLYIDNANGNGAPCTLYNTEDGMVGASIAGISNPNWRALHLNYNVSSIIPREILKAHVYTYALISRR